MMFLRDVAATGICSDENERNEPAGGPKSSRPRQVKVEPFAKRKQQRPHRGRGP